MNKKVDIDMDGFSFLCYVLAFMLLFLWNPIVRWAKTEDRIACAQLHQLDPHARCYSVHAFRQPGDNRP